MKAQRLARGAVLAGGLALLGFGVAGFLGEPYLNGQRLSVLVWGAGAIVLHDGLWSPVLLLVGAVVVRRAPARVRGPVVAGLMVAAALTVVGLPAVLREGQHNGNATLLPLPYLRNWLLSLLAVGVVLGGVVGVPPLRDRWRGRRRGYWLGRWRGWWQGLRQARVVRRAGRKQ